MSDLQSVIDHHDIHQCMMRYCHGVDRCDLEILKSAFWEDSICKYGIDETNAIAWAAATIGVISSMERTFHSVSNYLIDVDGNVATSETYCTAYHQIKAEEGVLTEMIVGGRYLDKHEKRHDEWRIKYRLYIHDWNSNMPSTEQGVDGMLGSYPRGERSPRDAYYAFLK